MSYFIFKGQNSDNFNVIVENLPHVTKPPKRYNLVEIDGNNRTDIEDLGYNAYEKTISLGLRDAYLEEAYDWLIGSGQLTLSNEPDKYYNAAILEQIDYERALRFRKAKVNFLVQPFKYLIGELETESLTIMNQGSVESLPLITIYGSGTVELMVNGFKFCTLNVDGYITLDSEAEEAHKDSILKNRSMTGSFPVFLPGLNTISYTGTVTKIVTQVRSRWL